MYQKLFLFICISIFSLGFCQKLEFHLSISPFIDHRNSLNQNIINTFSEFLIGKDKKYWLATDFEKYPQPYYELFDIEAGRLGENFYQPSLMAILPTKNEKQKIVKVAFVGYDPATENNNIKAIYNLVANVFKDKILFSRYLDYAVQDWKSLQKKSVVYRTSPTRTFNLNEIERQEKDVQRISKFFETEPIDITYYSCISPAEVFKIKGFDFHPMMYADESGGLAENKNIVFSGNNSDYYTHEIVHLYTAKFFPKSNRFLDEGLATYFGGSGKFPYVWQRSQLKKFWLKNPTFSISEHYDVYEDLFFEKETPVLYVFSALICERTLRLFGKEKLFKMFEREDSLPEILKSVGLTKENMNIELMKELDRDAF